MRLGEAILYLTTDNADLESGLEDAENAAASSASRTGGVLTGISQGIGQAIFGLAAKAGGAVVGMAQDALNSYASYERLAGSLQSLVARELIQNSGTEKYIKTGTAKLELTEKERAKLADLELQQRKLNDEIAIGEDRLASATAKGKESAAELDLRKIRLEEMRAKLAETTSEIDKLHNKDGKLVDVTQRVVEGQMSMSEAMAQAGPKAKELLDWIEKLAVQSPFTEDDVAQAFKLSMSYGFTTEQAKGLTQTMIDFAAGSGQSGQAMGQIALALGQIQARGKLAGGEIMQLTNAGVPVRQILAQAFGVTTAQLEKMVEAGVIPADKAIKAITDSLNRDFGGAAKAQSATFSGLLSSLEDIKSIGLRELFAGTFQAVQPYLASVVDVLSSPDTRAKITAFGDAMGQKVAGGIKKVSDLLAIFKTDGIRATLVALGVPQWVLDAWDTGAKHIDAIKGALTGLGSVLAGATIAGGILAIGGAIMGLFTPIGLIAMAATLLGAAWAEDWGGIREKTQAAIDFLKPYFDDLLGWIGAAAKGDFGPLKEGLQGALTKVTATIQEFKWSDFVAKLTDWGAYIKSLPWGTYVAALTSWGAYITALSWSAILPILTDWGAYIVNLDWTKIIERLIDWATWIPALSWVAFVTSVAWGGYIAVLAWKTFIGPFTWENWANKLDWAIWIGKLTWSGFVAFLKWDAWILGLAWGDFVKHVKWIDWIAQLSGWGEFVPPLTWTSFVRKIDLSDWIPDFGSWKDYIFEWLSGGGGQSTAPPATNDQSNQNVKGSSVADAAQYSLRSGRGLAPALAVAGAGRGGGQRNIYITVNAALGNQMDVLKLGRRLANAIEAAERY